MMRKSMGAKETTAHFVKWCKDQHGVVLRESQLRTAEAFFEHMDYSGSGKTLLLKALKKYTEGAEEEEK